MTSFQRKKLDAEKRATREIDSSVRSARNLLQTRGVDVATINQICACMCQAASICSKKDREIVELTRLLNVANDTACQWAAEAQSKGVEYVPVEVPGEPSSSHVVSAGVGGVFGYLFGKRKR